MPFLENVTRGRNVPRERLVAVAEHYQALRRQEPDQRAEPRLDPALEQDFRAHGIELPISSATATGRRRLRGRHERLVPARCGVAEGRQGTAQRVAAAVRPTRTSRSSRLPRSRRTGGGHVTAYPGPDRRTRGPPTRSKRLRNDVMPGVERDRRARRGGRLHRVQRGLLERGGRQAAAVRRVVVLLSALLLLVVFRSVVIPIKAAIMNLLSIGAALGLRDADLPGGPRRRPARDRHRPDRVVRAGDDVRDRLRAEHGLRGVPHVARPRGVGAHRRRHGAVGRGLQTTGRVITAAASIMIVVFARSRSATTA